MDDQIKKLFMFTIKFIDNIYFKKYNLCADGREDTSTNVFLKQGQLDGACAIYSLLMMLILHKRINGNDLTKEISQDDPPYIKRLKNQFLNPLKGIRSCGTSLNYLRGMLLNIFDDQIRVSVYCNKEEDDDMLHFRIRNQLDSGCPVMIAYSKPKDCGHALVVIGYTMLEGIMRLYCIDPGGSAPWCNFWNNIIDIDLNDDKEDWPDICHLSEKKIKVDQILLIDENPNMELCSPFDDIEKCFEAKSENEPTGQNSEDEKERIVTDYGYILIQAKQYYYGVWDDEELKNCIDKLPLLNRQELVSLYTSRWIADVKTLKKEILKALYGVSPIDSEETFRVMSTNELIYEFEKGNSRNTSLIRQELRRRYLEDMGDDRIKIYAAFQNGSIQDQKWIDQQIRRGWKIKDSGLPF
jgi:hypothetical protein